MFSPSCSQDFVLDSSTSGGQITFKAQLEFGTQKFVSFSEEHFLLTVLDKGNATSVETGDVVYVPSDSVSVAASTDTTTIPDRFASVIVDGAVAYVYQYRGEIQQYQVNFERFQQGIKNMQSLLVNKYEYVRSTMIQQPTGYFSSGALN